MSPSITFSWLNNLRCIVHVVVAVVIVTALLLLLVVGAAAVVDDQNGDVIGVLCGFQQILTSSVVMRWHIPLVKNLQLITRDSAAVIHRNLILQRLTSHMKWEMCLQRAAWIIICQNRVRIQIHVLYDDVLLEKGNFCWYKRCSH